MEHVESHIGRLARLPRRRRAPPRAIAILLPWLDIKAVVERTRRSKPCGARGGGRAITAEYLALKDASGALPPSDYEDGANSDHGEGLHKGETEWHWASLIDRGRRQESMWKRCPNTAAALEAIGPGRLCEGEMPFAFAFFSTLRGASRIAPHYAPANLRVRVHLPLLVPEPEKCGMRVAGETRHWKVGEALAFDDAFEHEVWNDGVEERVVLLLDLWHPDLTPEEIDGVRGMFREIERMQEARREKG